MKRSILALAAVAALATGMSACEMDTSTGGTSVDNTGSGSKSADSSGSKASGSSSSSKASSGSKAKPSKSPSKPKGTVVGGFQVVGKVQITKDGLGDYTAVMRAKNVESSPKIALFKVTVLKGTNILGTIDCIGGGGNEVAPGATTTTSCTSVDKFKSGWDDVQIESNGF